MKGVYVRSRIDIVKYLIVIVIRNRDDRKVSRDYDS
jgi:hypothetical protein